MSAAIASDSQPSGSGNSTPSQPRHRRPRRPPSGEDSSIPGQPGVPREHPRRPRRPAEEGENRSHRNDNLSRGEGRDAVGSRSPAQSRASSRPPRRRHRHDKDGPGGQPGADRTDQPPEAPTAPSPSNGDAQKASAPSSGKKTGRRGGRFKSSLSEAASGSATDGKVARDGKTSEKYRVAVPQGDDLTSRLIYELSTPPFPDCLICFAPIHPAQPTWSCSPSNPLSVATEGDESGSEGKRAVETAQCCWTTFHLKCIRSWAAKSVKDIEEAWRARGEERVGEWRCPGCQSKRTPVPASYW